MILNFIEGKRYIKHKDDKEFTHFADEEDNLDVRAMIDDSHAFKRKFNMEYLFKPAFNRDINVIVLSEKDDRSAETVEMFNEYKMNNVQLEEVTIENNLLDKKQVN